jgi:hypothetical protein
MVRSERKKQNTEEKIPSTVLAAKRRNLELARSHVMRQIEVAKLDAHRSMLRRALADVDQELKKLA